MLNEVIMLQSFLLIILFYFVFSINLLNLWYLAGMYLFISGLILFLNDGDIFVGFLWVIDLGVGLIFFIFILHFSNFLHQKAQFNVIEKFSILFLFLFLFFFFCIMAFPTYDNVHVNYQKTWFFFLSWYDYYELFHIRTITDLNILREMYFYNNSFEFVIINFIILYGIFAAICLSFLIKRIFNFSTFSQLNNTKMLNQINSYFFIRNQNFIKQQNISAGTRVWLKNKYFQI